jgi:hypothetical protein
MRLCRMRLRQRPNGSSSRTGRNVPRRACNNRNEQTNVRCPPTACVKGLRLVRQVSAEIDWHLPTKGHDSHWNVLCLVSEVCVAKAEHPNDPLKRPTRSKRKKQCTRKPFWTDVNSRSHHTTISHNCRRSAGTLALKAQGGTSNPTLSTLSRTTGETHANTHIHTHARTHKKRHFSH